MTVWVVEEIVDNASAVQYVHAHYEGAKRAAKGLMDNYSRHEHPVDALGGGSGETAAWVFVYPSSTSDRRAFARITKQEVRNEH